MSLAALPVPTTRKDINLLQTVEILREADDILVVSHQRPDGDCLGSTLALMAGLEKLGKRVAAFNAGPVGEKWDFLPAIAKVAQTLPTWTPKYTVFVDCGGPKRVSETFVPSGTSLNIDHHLTNERFGDFNFIDIDACAVGEQVHDILLALGVEIDKVISQSIYLSIMTDTGGFRYANTTARALEIAGKCVARGASPGEVALAVYESRSRGELALTGIVLNRLNFEFDGGLVWSELYASDYAANGGTESEPEGLVTEMRSVKGVEVSALIHETPEGWTRAGFRGKGNVDCSAIAAACGGGGHFNASGVMMRNVPFAEGKARILSVVRDAFEKWKGTK